MRKLSGVAVFALVLGLTACGDAGSEAEGGAEAATDSLSARANGVAAIDLATFAADPESHEGHEIRLANVPVDSRMGTQGFWLKLPNQGLYLVRGTAESTGSVQAGQNVTVAGTVHAMGDSVVAAWIEEGTITADQEMEARYATSYMDAWYVSSGQQATAGAAQEE
jgi:hypothetical protein